MSSSKIHENEKGIALMMVITAIVLLSAIMLSFNLDTTVNKIKTYNMEDKAQAKLTAESGLRFAMARLKLYKDAYNYVQSNDGAKDIAKPELLNIIWNFPFIYPIPVTQSMNKLQKEAIKEFQESTLIQGTMRLTITNLSNKLNLNALRISLLNNINTNDGEDGDDDGDDESSNSDKADEKYNLESQLLNSLQTSFNKKIENDDDFNSLYAGLEVTELIDIIKFNVSDKESVENASGVNTKFTKIPMAAKHTPFASMSELFSLPDWDDDLVDLIKNEFTVHGAIMVDLNKITDKLLRILVPNITDDEVKEFFDYKNDPEDPKFFNTKDDFKKYIVQIANLMSSDDFDDLMTEFEKNGIKFGPSASLFKITSVGEKDRASYTIEAYITIPAKPAYRKQESDEEGEDDSEGGNDGDEGEKDGDSEGDNDGDSGSDSDSGEDDKEAKVFLLNPRIVEIYAK